MLNNKLRVQIKEESENICAICGEWIHGDGTPHHITKVSEEKLLENCKANIIYLDFKCHHKTEYVPGFNTELKKQLQGRYMEYIAFKQYYSPLEMSKLVSIHLKDLDRAITKQILKTSYSDGIVKASGEDFIRFLMGGHLQ